MAEKQKESYDQKLGGFANKLMSNPASVPIQEVVPIMNDKSKKEGKPEEAQLNVWIPKVLVKKLKRHALDSDMSLKEITIKALEAYLNR